MYIGAYQKHFSLKRLHMQSIKLPINVICLELFFFLYYQGISYQRWMVKYPAQNGLYGYPNNLNKESKREHMCYIYPDFSFNWSF